MCRSTEQAVDMDIDERKLFDDWPYDNLAEEFRQK
jgi:hypothetical protein